MSEQSKHETVTVTKTTRSYTCDVCSKAGMPERYICDQCARDVCCKCCISQGRDPWTDSDNGDYQPLFCKACEAALAKYVEPLKVEHARHEAAIDAIRRQWDEETKR